jgi:hypothetical protein
MRKFLLASVTAIGTAGLYSAAHAQAPAPAAAPLPMNPVQGGFVSAPLASPPVGANNNNNKQAPALPGPAANPTPGTVVVHFNGFAVSEFETGFTGNGDHRIATNPAGINITTATSNPPLPPGAGIGLGAATGTAAAAGNNGAGNVKTEPLWLSAYGRLFAGVDGMATNGLRYGAGLEIRENFTSAVSTTASSGASAYLSTQTMFIRRAFTYVAGENWGIVRVGQADGLISLFDSGVTTFQFLPSGNLNGGDATGFVTGGFPSFVYLAVAGNEYGNAKAVYLSPQIAGFDFGIQYAPNTSNGEAIGNTGGGVTFPNGSGTGTGGCTGPINSGCPNLTSGPGLQDGSRMYNQVAVGLRYQGIVGGVGLLTYAVGEFGQHSTYTGGFGAINAANPTAASLSNPITNGTTAATGGFSQSLLIGTTGISSSRYTGQYKDLAIGSFGIAGTFAGVTVGGNVIGGNMNGQLGLQPQGGAPLFGFLLGAKYINGPFTIGIVGEEFWEQGTSQLAGLTQRRGRALNAGFSYTIAPGFTAWAEYIYGEQKQNLNNFNSGFGQSGTLNNNVTTNQGFLIGNIISF